MEYVVLVLIVGALEKVMGNCFGDESTAIKSLLDRLVQ